MSATQGVIVKTEQSLGVAATQPSNFTTTNMSPNTQPMSLDLDFTDFSTLLGLDSQDMQAPSPVPVTPFHVTTYDVKSSRRNTAQKEINFSTVLPTEATSFQTAPMVCLRELMFVEIDSPLLSDMLTSSRCEVKQHTGISDNLSASFGDMYSLSSNVYVVVDGIDLCVYCLAPRSEACCCRVSVLPQHRTGTIHKSGGNTYPTRVGMGVYLKIALSCMHCKGKGRMKDLKRKNAGDRLSADVTAQLCPICQGNCRKLEDGKFSDGLLIGALPRTQSLKAPLLRVCFEVSSNIMGARSVLERHEGLIQVCGKGYKSSRKSKTQGPRATFSADDEMELQEFIREEMAIVNGWESAWSNLLGRTNRQAQTNRELLHYFRRRSEHFAKRRRVDESAASTSL